MNPSGVQTQTRQNKQVRLSSPSCNAQSQVSAEKALSQRYRLIREIGHGTQAKVYEAKRLSDDQSVAIKELRIDSLQNWKAYDLFWREVETLKSLDIEGVAKFYEVIEQLDGPHPCAYLVQQYIPGKTLSEMIRSGYRFDIPTVFMIAVQFVDILKALHHHEPPIIHRDIKPSNIVIEQKDDKLNVYLIDFGAVANPLLQKGGSTVAGTYGYMPPEQLMGKPVAASDIYALGATIAGLLSGMEPSDMDVVDYRLAIEKPLENLPYHIVSCLRQMIQPKVEDRLCDYDILKNRFEQFASGAFTITTGEEALNKNKNQYSKRLKSVHALGLRENYDLWNELPEATPRKIPSCYQWRSMIRRNRKTLTFFNILYNIPNQPLVSLCELLTQEKIYRTPPAIFPRFKLANLIQFPYYSITYPIRILLCIFIKIIHAAFISLVISGTGYALAIIIGLVCYFLINDFYLPSYKHFIDRHWIYIFIFLTSIIALIYLIKWYRTSFCDKNKPLACDKTIYQSLLQNGRKTLATIQSIQYIGTNETDQHGYYLADSGFTRSFDSAYHYAYFNYYCDVPPAIRITYAFNPNPPDDSSEFDLVHSVIVPTVSEKYLKAGDLLPILYEVNPSDSSCVNSMPFPIPFSKPMKINNIMFVSGK